MTSMTDWKCLIERAAARDRCDAQCESCRQQDLRGQDGRLVFTCETASGLYFDFSDPRPEQVSLDDVAHHLSQVCRFAASTVDEDGDPRFLSVAEHALHTVTLVRAAGAADDVQLAALHHDSHEYMLGDWPTPLKRLLRVAGVEVLDRIRDRTNRAIGERFGIDPCLFDHPLVKQADTEALYREAAAFKASRGVGPHWGRSVPAVPFFGVPKTSRFVKNAFIAQHRALGGVG